MSGFITWGRRVSAPDGTDKKDSVQGSAGEDRWNRCGIDTAHITFRANADMGVGDHISGMASLLDEIGLAGSFHQRDRGRNGFENGLTFDCGLELDWTEPGRDSPNQGYLSSQFKGKFFQTLGALEVGIWGLFLEENRIHKVTRLDAQVTSTDCPLVQELIAQFRSGRLVIPRRPAFEPKGQELEGGKYPKGATLCSGSRSSDAFCRAYDKHLEPNGEGPPRLRAEVEFKGKLAAAGWEQYIRGWRKEAKHTPEKLDSEVRLSQQLVRTYMPIRDVSQWEGQVKPKGWTSKAPEPDWWADLFQAKAERLTIKKEASAGLRRMIARNRVQSGGRFLQDLVLTELDMHKEGQAAMEEIMDFAVFAVACRMATHATDTRLTELLQETPPEYHEFVKARWAFYGRMGGTLQEEWIARGFSPNPPM